MKINHNALAMFGDMGRPPRLTKPQERSLVRQMRTGNREAARILFCSAFGWAVKSAARYQRSDCLTAQDVQDIASDAVINALATFMPSKSRLTTYVRFQVLIQIQDRRRLDKSSEELTPFILCPRSPNPARVAEVQELRENLDARILEAIASAELSDAERLVLDGRISGMTTHKMAWQLGVTTRRVEQLHSAAARKVRERMGIDMSVSFHNQYRSYDSTAVNWGDGKARKRRPAQQRLDDFAQVGLVQ